MPRESFCPGKKIVVFSSPRMLRLTCASPALPPNGRDSGTTLYTTANEVALFVLLLKGIS